MKHRLYCQPYRQWYFTQDCLLYKRKAFDPPCNKKQGNIQDTVGHPEGNPTVHQSLCPGFYNNCDAGKSTCYHSRCIKHRIDSQWHQSCTYNDHQIFQPEGFSALHTWFFWIHITPLCFYFNTAPYYFLCKLQERQQIRLRTAPVLIMAYDS